MRGLEGPVSQLALPGGSVGAPDQLLSFGMVFGELRALLERVGRASQGQRQEFRNLPGMTYGALGIALARRGLALAGRLLSAISRRVTPLLVRDPPAALSVPVALLGAWLTLISQTLPLVRQFAVVGRPLALIGESLALIGEPLALVGDPLALIGDAIALVRDPVPFISGLLTLVGHPFATLDRPLVFAGDPRAHRWLSGLGRAIRLAAQDRALALEDIIVGGELRRPPVDLRAAALDLDTRPLIAVVKRAGAQLLQIRPVGFKPCRLAL